MKTKRKVMTQEETDRFVIARADNDSAWEKPMSVRKAKSKTVMLPSDLADQAAFFARLHREKSLANWLKRVIRERLDIEEAAFAGSKKELLARNIR
ncbi:MAG: hypothetical protein HZC48_11530 [Nitrospirae bacterium]|nr:hypothetical protein [Nitrospirota bacterium]